MTTLLFTPFFLKTAMSTLHSTKHNWLLLLTGLILLLSDQGKADQPVQHLVLVSVDGLSASYLSDPRAKMPNLRKLAAQGAVAKGMLTSFPSVTWPSHTSLITGTSPARHGVIGNSVWDRKDNKTVQYIGDPVLTKKEAIRVPTLYDLAHQSGLSTASVIWPCSNGAKTLDWVIPDSNKPELHKRYTTPGFVEELNKVGIDISQLGHWGWGKQHSIPRDILYTQVTKTSADQTQSQPDITSLDYPRWRATQHGTQCSRSLQSRRRERSTYRGDLAGVTKTTLRGTLHIVRGF